MHYIIIVVFIAGIVILQFLIFFDNKKELSLFKNIFPFGDDNFQLIQDVATNSVLGIETQYRNDILEVITSSINNYLEKNIGAVSDFHLMKDIVDRNCDAKEDEINTQIPMPLYLGLAGTMLGILIGVGFLIFGGGLKELLDSGNGSGAQGIETLFGGVALAMISSINGIILTTIGSHFTKNAKTYLEGNKNNFLSWIQSELLPNISNDTSSALIRMTENLSVFNKTFARNTLNLKATLEKVDGSYQKQAEIMKAINQLRIGDIASANIEVYDKLKNSTNEIGVFADYLQNSNKYLSAIQSLNEKLDIYERRTQVIENAGNFFTKNEKWLAVNFDAANLEVKAALERFISTTGEFLSRLQESFAAQILDLDSLMHVQQEKLQDELKLSTDIISESFMKTQSTFEKEIYDGQQILKSKLNEVSIVIEELRNLTSIKEGIKGFKEAINRQNSKIDELTKEIRSLAKVKVDGGAIKQEISFPRWFKYLTIIGGGLIVVTSLFYVVPIIIKWVVQLIAWLF